MNWESVLDWTRDYYERLHALRNEDIAFWADNVVFTWRWWLKVALLVIPWIVWLLARKKDSSRRLLTAGILVIAISFLLDEVGTMLGLWFYSTKLLPFIPGNFVYNVTMLPVAVMLLIQWFPKINRCTRLSYLPPPGRS